MQEKGNGGKSKRKGNRRGKCKEEKVKRRP
jgi:hypothetical protein